ncbi:MAG: 2-C-methyl-D-erythritol 4-phosphate cytidylyltransferase [Deltaproteobacteria bacterium]|nr:2-C-methyl-D-erythritol 4-phosphate cytidylyltransferase [Deltaproteobacteria bacterium]
MQKSKNFAIIVAAGKGLRMESKTKKQYLELDGIPVLTRTIMKFDDCDMLHEIILVIPGKDFNYCEKHIIDPFLFSKKIHLVEGGKVRQDSVLNGLKFVRERTEDIKKTIVLIHDGVRPFVDQGIIENSILNALEYKACIPCIKITETVKEKSPGTSILKTLDRRFLYTAQTPQAFEFNLIFRAFDHAVKTSFLGTDDASLVEHLGHKVAIIKGSKLNMKITTPEDLVLGKYLLTLKIS